eukprot:TRINITY_DN40016_c0_g1_i1.p1 TRINITY_DN40016_c0_g1~~TRINITY_DN40016_c0_g1_i1.p1  ORF type:complete len:1038 (+),score=368.42 TRINITY_DN40016_c0_g1_i1:66-3116(+)
MPAEQWTRLPGQVAVASPLDPPSGAKDAGQSAVQAEIEALATQMSAVTAEHVAAQVVALNRGYGPEFAQANLWLQAFQRTIRSWAVLKDVLAAGPTAPLPLVFFAAQSLRSKVRKGDLSHQLDQQERDQLNGELLQLLVLYAAGPVQVRTQLCLATAVALAQEAFWHEDRNVVLEAGAALQGHAGVLLELLTLLAEEATRVIEGQDDAGSPRHNAATSPRRAARRHPLLAAVTKAAPAVLSMLHERWGGGDSEAILRCLARWLRFAGSGFGGALAQSPIVDAAVASLAQSDDAADVVSELAQLSGGDPGCCGAVIAKISGQVPTLAAAYSAAAADIGGLPLAKRLCRTLASIGESYSGMIAQASPDALTLVDLLVQCSSHADTEGVAAGALPFWSALNHEMNSPELQAAPAERARRIAAFLPLLTRLCDVLVQAVQYDFQCGAADELDSDVESFRDDILAAAVSDVVSVVDTPALQHVWGTLQSSLAGGPAQWRAVEAKLYFLWAGFNAASEPSAIVPHLIGCCGQLPADIVRVRRTFTRVISRCAPWIGGLPGFQSVLVYCAEGAGMPAVADIGCSAMLQLCRSCHAQLGESGMYSALLGLRSRPGLSEGCREMLSSGIGAVVGESPPADVAAKVSALVQSVGAELQAALQQGDAAAAAAGLSSIAACIDAAQERTAHKPPEVRAAAAAAWCQGWGALWPLLEKLVHALAQREEAMSSFARIVSRTLKAGGTAFVPHLSSLASCIAAVYMQHPSGALLDCVASMVEAFASEASCVQPLISMLTELSAPTLSLLRAPGALATRTDLLRGYFRAMSTTVTKAPEVFLSALGASTIVFASEVAECPDLLGSLAEHRMAVAAALCFLDRVVDAADGYREPVALFLSTPLRDGVSAAASLAGSALRVACNKHRRTLECARAAALVFFGAWAAMTPLERQQMCADTAKLPAPPPQTRELSAAIQRIPIAHTSCDLCGASPPGGVVRCRRCGSVLAGVEQAGEAFEDLFLSVPVKTGGGSFD